MYGDGTLYTSVHSLHDQVYRSWTVSMYIRIVRRCENAGVARNSHFFRNPLKVWQQRSPMSTQVPCGMYTLLYLSSREHFLCGCFIKHAEYDVANQVIEIRRIHFNFFAAHKKMQAKRES